MRTTTLRTSGFFLSLLLLAAPHATSPATCTDDSARTLLAGAVGDALINPPGQEDTEFFMSQGGFPNIFFVIDTSGSMERLPPNGPAFLTDPAVLPSTAFVGCGSAQKYGSLGANPMLAAVAARTYHSPCGTTDYENKRYQGHDSVDYAHAASVCPNFKEDVRDGYDPDYFITGPALKVQGNDNPNLFAKDLVFHDNVFDGDDYAPGTADRGNGWSFTAVHPYMKSGAKGNDPPGSISDFCAAQTGADQNGKTRASICTACLTEQGWYYDGVVQKQTQEHITDKEFPSLWYTGNYLSFFPPKFVIARKVVKDVIAKQVRVRMAIAQFGDGGYDFRDGFNPSCKAVLNDNANFVNNRSTYINTVDALTWGGGTPLSMALFDVGRYYHTPTLPWFGKTWEAESLDNQETWESDPAANQLAVCWSCQTSSVILLTDGVPSPNDGDGLPNGTNKASVADSNSGKFAGDYSTGILAPSATDCPRCDDFPKEPYKNNLTKVAFYLHNYDLRSEGAKTSCSAGGTDAGQTMDGKGLVGKQVLDVYTVGFATSQLKDAGKILSNAADAGGGLYISADSADQLRKGMFDVFKEISERATSFSVATVSTLQTTTGHSVIVPRFDPARAPHWAGHLYRYELYSEFVNACTPNGTGDLDCDGACGSVFLQDKNGKFIAEDDNGHFLQTSGNLPLCAQTPRCVAKSKPCGELLADAPAASPWWDAYEALQKQKWHERSVWTVVDGTAPLGTLDQADGMLQFSVANAAAIRPYLGLGGDVCPRLAEKIQTAGDAVTAQVVRTSKLECAKTIIRFVLGADVLNEVGRDTPDWPPPLSDPLKPASATNLPDQDQLLDRKFKLGDIFHSSPVVVDAPLPADGILCPNGLHNQCMESLWRTPVKHVVTGTNQYDVYAKSTPYKNRRKMILVGANDGMLHAFNGGVWHPNENDTTTSGIDESKAPFFGYYDRGEDPGPQELWAFIPPDLLGKLPSLLTGEHQLMVDGTAMVRDVWVDGKANKIVDPAATLDDLKAASEFHTVAVVGERRGGTHFFALDVTDAAKPSGEPTFLWIYPQPGKAESFQFGETYTDFLPTPPPIGPVRIKADSNSGGAYAKTPEMIVPGVTDPVPYHERWVALLPGGYDPQHLRGRGVHMVDVWSGKEVFDFSYPTDTVAADDPRLGLKFPVAATPGMVMWGKSERRPSLGWENDGYFDTATFGDVGGQLWVLRFNAPGTMDGSGLVGDWYGARIFQMGTKSAGSLCSTNGGQPFFFITANTALPGAHIYRVYAGTGDRFNLLDTNGGICGPDNLRACAQRGCSVTLDDSANPFAATGLTADARALTQAACSGATQPSFTVAQSFTGAVPTCGVATDAKVVVTCPDGTFTKDVAVTCAQDADGDYGCRAGTAADRAAGIPDPGSRLEDLPTETSSTLRQSRNWYFSLKVFEDTGSRMIFKTPEDAAKYDGARYYLSDPVTDLDPLTATVTQSGDLTLIDGATNTTTVTATATSAGFAIYYNHGPSITTDDHTYTVSQLDERTSSASGLYGKVLWNTIQPALSAATTTKDNCSASRCAGAYRRLSYHYAADAVTGAPGFTDADGKPLRSIVQNTLVPAQGDQPTVFVNQKGQIAVGLTAVNAEKGASNLGMGTAMDPVLGLGVVEVTRDLHACRHAPAGPTDPPPDASKCK